MIKKEVKIKANYKVFQLSDEVTENSFTILNLIREFVRTGKKEIIDNLISNGFVLNYSENHNIVPTVGRNVLARLLAGDTTYSGEVDYGAIGNGVSPTFTNASTALSNEIYRKQASSQGFDDNISYIDWFIASGDVADGSYTEFGAFIDGTASTDSGQAFSLIAIPITKSGSVFVSAVYTLL